MKGYKHFNLEEREALFNLLQEGTSQADIARHLGRSESTISREINRNKTSGSYKPDSAQALSIQRRRKTPVLQKDEDLKHFVVDRLCSRHWTPEQIAGHLKHNQNTLRTVSHETIYAWIYSIDMKKEKLWKHLPRHKAKRGPRKYRGAGVQRIPNRVSIHERPAEINGKLTFGHWEADLMSFQKNTQFMLVYRERISGFVIATVLDNKTAAHTADASIAALTPIYQNSLKSITYDNGGEFAHHTSIKEHFNIATYFCDAYASWQKGGIENSNGRLRRDLPRKTNLFALSDEDFDEIIFNHNTTPRKNLGWQTPMSVFLEKSNCVALQT